MAIPLILSTPESKADITIPAGKSVQVNVEYSPQTKGLDEESYIRFSTANDVKIVEMTGESTVLTTLDLVSASVENAFSSDKLEYDVLGSEYGIDVSLTLKNTLGREISSDNLDINFSLLDASGNVVASGLDFYNTITIAGVETHVATDHLPAIEYDAVENGKYDVSLFVDIPASVTAGIYTLTASIDTDTDVMNHSLNADLGEYLIFQGATLVLDSGVSYLDEDQTQVDTSTIVDREVDFGVVPVQQSSDVETVTITNVSGETITVTGMTIDGDNFSFAYDQEYAYPAGYSDLRSVQIDRYEYFYGFSSDDANWMTLNVTEQCELTLDGFNVQSIDGLKVYDQYGHEFFSIDRYDTTYWDGIIIIPNAGTYYVELVGLEGDVNFAFLKRDVETNNQVLTVATNESDANKNTLNEFTQTDDYNLYNVTVKEATSFSLNVSADLTDNIIRLYDFYGIDINSYSDFYDDAYVLYQSGYYNDYQKYLPTVTLDIYDNTGINVYSYSYDYADIMTDYLAAVVAGDLTESEADAFFDQYVEKFDLFEAGTYSFVYTYSTLNDVDHEYYDYQVANLNFNFKAEGSAFKLDNGESMTIPLVFMPSHAVEYNGNDSSLTIVTTADNFEIELSGVGVVGDLAFDEAYLTGDYVNFGSYTYNDFDANGISADSMTFSYTAIESGTTTRMTMSIVNNGAGYVNSDAEVYFSLFDAEGTEYKLLLADGTDHLDLISYLKAEYDNRDVFMVDDAFDITVDLVIPATLAETNPYDFDSATMTLSEIQESLNFYTLVATIVQDDANLDSDAETDTAVFDNIYISSSDILVVGGHYQEDDGSIYLRENIIPVNTGGYTSGIDYAWDMDLIQTTIGEPQICYIDIFNRSDDDINITSVSIAALNGSDISDLFFVSLSDDYIQALPKSVTVEPGTVQRVYVFFDPQEYGDSADIGALVTIGTDIDQNGTTDESYCVTINPVVQGGDLRVLETSGATNDDNITIANTRVNEGASSITITLANSGDSDIIISEFDFGENSPFYVNYGEGDFTRYYKLKALSDGVPGTVEVTIYFDPETVGSYDQDFVIRSTDPAGGYQYTMHIQANGVNPAVDVVEDSGTANDNSLTFGNQAPDRAYEPVEKFTLNNYNVDPDTQENLLSDDMVVTGYSVGVNNADAGTFVVGIRTAEGDLIPISEFLADPANLAAGTSWDFEVNFTATELGSYYSVLTLYTDVVTGVDSEGNDIYKEIEIDLAGTVSKSVYSMKVDSTGQVLTDSDDDGNVEIDFGSVAATGNTTDGSQTFVKVLTFNVNGQTPINIDSISIDGAGYYLLDSNGNIVTDNVIDTFSGSDNVILNSGDKIYIRVMFDIDSLGSGLREGELKISGSQNITYDLTANVVEADIELVDTEAQFENTLIGQKSSVFVTVRNTGDSNLVIDGFTCEDTQFSLAKDTITIAPGQEQEVEIYYEPSTLYTTVTDFYLNTNDPDESSVAVALTGVSGGNVLEPSVSAGNNYVYVFNNANGKRVTLLISYTTADSLTKQVLPNRLFTLTVLVTVVISQ